MINVWDTKTGLVRREIDVPDGNGLFRLSPNEDLIAADSLGEISLWDPTTGRRIRTISTPREQIRALEFSPDGRTLAAAYGFGRDSVFCWDAHSGRTVYTLLNRFTGFPQLAFSPKGEQLAVGADRLTILKAATGIELRSIPRTGHGLIELAYSPDGKELAGLEHDGTNLWNPEKISVWGPDTGELERTVALPVDNTEYSSLSHSEGVSAFTAPSRNRSKVAEAPCILWDERQGLKLVALKGHSGEFARAAFSPDGSTIATGFGARSVTVWSGSSGQLAHDLPLNSETTAGNQGSLNGSKVEEEPEWGPTAIGTQIWFSLDGGLIAAASNHGLASFWDAKTGAKVPSAIGRAREILAIQFGADAAHFRIAFLGNELAEWDAASGVAVRAIRSRKLVASNEPEFGGRHELATLRVQGFAADGPYDGLISAAVDPDGKYVAAGCERGKIVIFDRPKQRELRVWQASSGWVNDVALTRDGTRLVSCSSGEPPAVWDALTGRKIRDLNGAAGPPWCVAISPDDRFALVGSLDGKCDLWELASGKHLLTLIDIDGGADWLAFDPAGHFDGSPFGRRLVAFRTVAGDMASTDALWKAHFSPGLVSQVLQLRDSR